MCTIVNVRRLAKCLKATSQHLTNDTRNLEPQIILLKDLGGEKAQARAQVVLQQPIKIHHNKQNGRHQLQYNAVGRRKEYVIDATRKTRQKQRPVST